MAPDTGPGPAVAGLLADLVLAAHAAFVAFVVLGLVAILAGGVHGWAWVRGPGFRVLHLAAIAAVTLEAWTGIECPLTTWENTLRLRAGQGLYGTGFVADWLSRLIYHDAPAWLFTAAYTVFAALVVVAWRWVPPRRRSPEPRSR
jgi:hypothetical protein